LFGFHESPSNSGDKASEHPLVTLHPETGERVLNISPLTLQHVIGLSAEDSEQLLGEITRHAFSNPAWIMRWEVTPGDVVMWDNRATMHLAPLGLPLLGTSRVVHRVTCKGQPFVSANGQPSRIVSGVPILAAHEEIERGMI
jgi:taurine dioxygenase